MIHAQDKVIIKRKFTFFNRKMKYQVIVLFCTLRLSFASIFSRKFNLLKNVCCMRYTARLHSVLML